MSGPTFFTNYDLVRRNLNELHYLKNLEFEYIIDCTTGTLLNSAELYSILHQDTVQTSRYGDVPNASPHERQYSDPTLQQQKPLKDLSLFIYDKEFSPKHNAASRPPFSFVDHEQVLAHKLSRGVDFELMVEKTKAQFFSNSDEQRYRSQAHRLAQEFTGIAKEVSDLVLGKEQALAWTDALLRLVAAQAGNFNNVLTQAKNSVKTYNVPTSSQFFNDIQLCLVAFRNIPVHSAKNNIISNLMDFIGSALAADPWYQNNAFLQQMDLQEYFSMWSSSVVEYRKEEVLDRLQNDIWAGVQGRLQIPLTVTLEDAVAQNLRFLEQQRARFGESGIAELVHEQFRLEGMMRGGNAPVLTVDKCYDLQKSMLANHNKLMSMFTALQDTAQEVVIQIDFIIEMYAFIDEAFESNANLEKFKQEHNQLLAGEQFFKNLLTFPQQIISIAHVESDNRAAALSYMSLPNSLEPLFSGKGRVKLKSDEIFSAIVDTVAEDEFKSHFGRMLTDLVPKEFSAGPGHEVATSTLMKSAKSIGCVTSYQAKEAATQTKATKVKSTGTGTDILGLSRAGIVYADRYRNCSMDKTTQCLAGLSKLNVTQIDTVELKKSPVREIISTSCQTYRQRHGSEKMPPIRFNKFRHKDIVYIFQPNASRTNLYELLQDSRCTSHHYFVKDILDNASQHEDNSQNRAQPEAVESSTSIGCCETVSHADSTTNTDSQSTACGENTELRPPLLAKIINMEKCRTKSPRNKYDLEEVGTIFYLVDVVLLEI